MRLLPVMRRTFPDRMAACSTALLVPANADAARKKRAGADPDPLRPGHVGDLQVRCQSGVGRQLQISGKRVTKGMRVSFRWSRGALATKLDRSRVGYVARVPTGTRAGSVSVTVSDRAGRRSNAIKITVTAPPPIAPTPAPAPGALPEIFRGNGMWIWQLAQSEGGNLAAIVNRARAPASPPCSSRAPTAPPTAGRSSRRSSSRPEGQGHPRLRVAVRLRQRSGSARRPWASTRSPPAPTAS